MGSDFQLVTNTDQSLLVRCPAPFFAVEIYAVLLFTLVACFWVATKIPDRPSKSQATTRLILRCAPFAELLILAVALGWSHTLAADWNAGTVTITDRFMGTYTTTHALRTVEISRALIDYDRSGPKIELLLSNGEVTAPFGVLSLFRRKQYLVLDAINAGLHRQGSTPGSAGAPAHSGDSSFDRMVRQQREFEQKLNAQKQGRETH